MHFSKKTIVVSISVMAVIICAGITLFILAPWRDSSAQNELSVKPDFETILPARSSIEELGGWQKMTPPNSTPIYVYSDSIDDIAISVSQQTLPESFRTDTDTKVAQLAKGYNATTSINAGNTKVYSGKSASGPQSIIFTKNNLLVLIKSRGVISNDAWASYIEALK